MYEGAFIMPQDYYVRFVIALSTNTLYEGTFIIPFFINKVYHFFPNHNTVEQKIETWAHCSITF